MIIDGNDLGGVLATPGVDWKRTRSNHIPKVFEILGVEAARQTIIDEMENGQQMQILLFIGRSLVGTRYPKRVFLLNKSWNYFLKERK